MEDEFTGRRILVVGGAGFVGGNLIKALLTRCPRQLVIVDNLLSAERVNVPDVAEVVFVEGSIADENILAGLRDDLDYVFHLATFHGNQNSMHDPLADHENNTLTTLKLYERIKSFKRIRKVVYASAGCTVAEKTCGTARATREDDPISLHLDSPYQISKITGEMYSNYYYQRYSLRTVKARFQNVYGPGEILGAGRWRGTPSTVWRNVTPTFVYKALKGGALPVEGTGEATRDFIYVDDIVGGLLACAARGAPGAVYNLASGVETSIRGLAMMINGLTGNTTPIEWRPQRNWDHSGKRYGSTVKARQEIGFEAKVDVKGGLTRTIEWTRENLPFIDACINKHAVHMPA